MKYTVLTIVLLILLPHALPAQFLFRDITPSTGIYIKSSEESAAGPGVIILDFNNDGWDDIFTMGGLDDDKLFLNMRDGTFRDITPTNVRNHLDGRPRTRGGIAFDYDNDGYTDLYITCATRDILWHNNGDTTFTDATRLAYLNFPLDKNESMTASFGDYDGDGYNDFYVARWIDENKFNFDTSSSGTEATYAHKGFPNWFYVNNHDGTFTDRAKQYGVDGDTGNTNIALFFDYDRDGDLDLLIGNDFGVELMYNHVYKNMLMETGVASFRDVTDSIGMGCHLFCMGIGPLDYNRDGHFDFYETTFGKDSLMKNNGKDIFHNVTSTDLPPSNGYERSGSGYMTTTWTALAGDFDNDGWEDEVVAHGFEGAIPPWITNPNKRDTSVFYRNYNGKFSDYIDSAMVDSNMQHVYYDFLARGIGAIDFNHDGKLDLCVSSLAIDPLVQNSDTRMLENISPYPAGSRHWLEMKFTAKRTAKEAIGTIVDVWAGGKVCSRQVSTGGGFGTQTSLTQHVGLGEFTMADSVIVYWPCDKHRHRQIDRYNNVVADRMYTITENMTENTDYSLLKRQWGATESVVKNPVSASPKVYPNPAHDLLSVLDLSGSDSKRIEIYDLLGRKRISATTPENSLSVSISSLQPGCYVLRILVNGLTTTQQFIKE